MDKDEMKDKLAKIQKLVDEQSEDEGLWFKAEYVSEAYLREALRELHRVVEEDWGS